MGKKLKLRLLLGLLKDKVSLVRATISIKRKTSSIRVAVIRATSRDSTSPASEHRIAAVLQYGHGTRSMAFACVDAIMNRVHRSRNVYVVFKSLILLHNILSRGSLILKEQLSDYPSSSDRRNFLNLSNFIDKTDVHTWEFSSWVRWYASFLELNLITSRVLGSYFTNIDKGSKDLGTLRNSNLIKELDGLVGVIEEICRAPKNTIDERNNLVFQVMRLIGEDYRSVQHRIRKRLGVLDDRLSELKSDELGELISCFGRIEECREKLVLLFVNRKQNDAFWVLIKATKMKFVEVEEEREKAALAITSKNDLTRLIKRVATMSQFGMRLLPSEQLKVDLDHVTITTAMR